MLTSSIKRAPGHVRDAIIQVLSSSVDPLSVTDILERVAEIAGETPASSVRSYLTLNTPDVFVRERRGVYRLRKGNMVARQRELPLSEPCPTFTYGRSRLFHADCFDWLESAPDNSVHAAVTDPPYGLHEYSGEQKEKLRAGRGGVWRIPPSFDGHKRSPLPRFTTLTESDLNHLRDYFELWGRALMPKLTPGAHVVVASNPLVSYMLSCALSDAGLERRGEIARLVMTMRGGDRPKAAHTEFSEVSVMPRSMWEPWLVYRKPLEGRVQDNLRKWGTGGFRRPSKDKPFGDVIVSAPTRKNERMLADHPSLKPQAFLRQLVRAVLPLGEGVVLDTFAGSGSLMAAAEAVGYESVGTEKDQIFFEMACGAIPRLAAFEAKPVSLPAGISSCSGVS